MNKNLLTIYSGVPHRTKVLGTFLVGMTTVNDKTIKLLESTKIAFSTECCGLPSEIEYVLVPPKPLMALQHSWSGPKKSPEWQDMQAEARLSMPTGSESVSKITLRSRGAMCCASMMMTELMAAMTMCRRRHRVRGLGFLVRLCGGDLGGGPECLAAKLSMLSRMLVRTEDRVRRS